MTIGEVIELVKKFIALFMEYFGKFFQKDEEEETQAAA